MSKGIFYQLLLPVDHLPAPRLSPDFISLATRRRIIATLKYSVLSFEYWIAPGGWLRQWIRFNIAILVLAAVPSIIVIPIITYLVMAGYPIMQVLVHIFHNTLYAVFLLIIIGSVIHCAYLLIKYHAHPLVQGILIAVGATTFIALSYHWFGEYIKYVFYSVKFGLGQ